MKIIDWNFEIIIGLGFCYTKDVIHDFINEKGKQIVLESFIFLCFKLSFAKLSYL